jgi:hypothetical protein
VCVHDPVLYRLVAVIPLLAGCASADGDVETGAPLIAAPTTATSSTSTSEPEPSPPTIQPPTTATPTSATTTVATPPPAAPVRLVPPPTGAVVVEAADPASLAIAASAALFAASPVVVVTSAASGEHFAAAAEAAESIGVPLLLATDASGAAVGQELGRLGAQWVISVGELPPEIGAAMPVGVTVVADARAVPAVARAEPPAGVAVLVRRDDPNAAAAVVTTRAAGLPVVAVDGGDPRAAADSREALRSLAPAGVLAVGTGGSFPANDVLQGLVATVVSGQELPGGGQLLFPGRRLVALYGHPGEPDLGALGEQPVEAAVERARQVAAEYAASAEPVVPTFEIITTVASAEPGPDGDYSLESPLDHVRPWVDAARAAGFYVIIELQPGHTEFLTQARRYEELLIQPHVGLALDPEWRLAPGERHLRDVGQVSAEEVNRVADWLAELTRRHALPQKLLLLQQFRLDMLPDRGDIAAHPELALVVQMDGFGTQNLKLDTWGAITQGGPPGVRFGWKQFYDEDRPVRPPAETLALEPSPVFISYQ